MSTVRNSNRQLVSHVHKDVAEVAKAAAAELYEQLMGDNLMYETWRKQNPGATQKQLLQRFVARNWGKCIPVARATMARLLTTTIDESVKEKIMEALVLDKTLQRGRAQPKVLLGSVEN